MKIKAITIILLLTAPMAAIFIKAQKVEWALKNAVARSNFHNGLAIYDDEKTHLYGAINNKGEIAIQPVYKRLTDFTNGYAVATTNEGCGIINTHGHWILQPIYDDYYIIEETPGLITLEKENKKGLFYNGTLILPCEYRYIYGDNFPFIKIDFDNRWYGLNLTTGEWINYPVHQGPFIVGTMQGRKMYYTKDGEPVDSSLYLLSSKGVSCFKDSITNLYGFRDGQGVVKIPPKFIELVNSIWISDAMEAMTKDSIYALIDADGVEHELCTKKEEFIYGVGDYFYTKKNDSIFLYNNRGLLLLALQGTHCGDIKGTTDWINIFDTYPKSGHLYDIKKKIIYEGIMVNPQEGMASVVCGNLGFFINLQKREKVKVKGEYSEYKTVSGFSEGLAVVILPNHRNAIIDKKGNIVLKENEKIGFYGDGFSEGVMRISKEENGLLEFGYIYNPLGHKGFYYKSSNKMALSDFTIRQWRSQGKEYFEKGKYGTAKDFFYRVMINKPDDVEAIVYYGMCLNNLKYYDEAIEAFTMALDIDNENELACRNIEIARNNKRNSEQRKEQNMAKSNAFWDALGNFANVLGQISGAKNVYNSYSSMNSGYDKNIGSTSGGGGSLQIQYSNWERAAQRSYQGLTNLGYSHTKKNGNKSGSTLQSMSGSNYVQMKKNLRDAQREMQRIRREAAKNGVNIPVSQWENATVSY